MKAEGSRMKRTEQLFYLILFIFPPSSLNLIS